jgi:hypothetical protein
VSPNEGKETEVENTGERDVEPDGRMSLKRERKRLKKKVIDGVNRRKCDIYMCVKYQSNTSWDNQYTCKK